MPGIGIRNLVGRGTDYTINFIEQFIKSSENIKKSIKGYRVEDQIDEVEDSAIRRNMMIALIRDTYVCNLLLGYTGTMRLLSDDTTISIFEHIDSKLLKYVDNFLDDSDFRNSISHIYTKYRAFLESLDIESIRNHQEELEITRFLERMIDRLQIDGKRASINSCISMLENKIYNLINVTPLIPLDSHYLTFDGADRIEISGRKKKKNGEILEIPINYDNYNLLVNNIKSAEIRHAVELKYRSRAESTLKDFADLIIYRKLFAAEMGYQSYFKYVTRDKKDNSDAIKKLIISLNEKIENQVRVELLHVYDYYNRRSDRSVKKITSGDIEKYVKIHSSQQTFDKYVVMFFLFKTINKYFNISIKRHDFEPDDLDFKFKSFELIANNIVLGRFYMDIDYSETKRIIDPISIKVSDRMMISDDMFTTPEVVLLANLGDKITYRDVVNIFKEFGYVLQELCYRSGVGLVNRDPEFSNFIPLLMENIAWDRDTVRMITQNDDVTAHIISTRHFDISTRLKHKCIFAKFDHLLHNSDDVINLLVQIVRDPRNQNEEMIKQVKSAIIELYQTIYRESFANMADIFDIPENSISSIDPLAIVLEINGSQGLLYSNLMNEIFAYSCFYILKNDLRSPDDFRSLILEDGVTAFRDLVSEFMRIPGLNSFQLFLNGMLGISDEKSSHHGASITPLTDQVDTIGETDNMIDLVNTDYDSTFNYFDDRFCITDDNTKNNYEEDHGSIIRIKKV